MRWGVFSAGTGRWLGAVNLPGPRGGVGSPSMKDDKLVQTLEAKGYLSTKCWYTVSQTQDRTGLTTVSCGKDPVVFLLRDE